MYPQTTGPVMRTYQVRDVGGNLTAQRSKGEVTLKSERCGFSFACAC